MSDCVFSNRRLNQVLLQPQDGDAHRLSLLKLTLMVLFWKRLEMVVGEHLHVIAMDLLFLQLMEGLHMPMMLCMRKHLRFSMPSVWLISWAWGA